MMKCAWCLVLCLGIQLARETDSQVFPSNVQPSGSVGVASLIGGNTGNPQAAQQALPTPPKECCAVLSAQQFECGYPGITEALCNINGCCFDASPGNKFWCFQPLAEPCPAAQVTVGQPVFVPQTPPPVTQPALVPATQSPTTQRTALPSAPSTCTIARRSRISCAAAGILKNDCLVRGCCFNDQAVGQATQCYLSTRDAPRLSSWSDWTTCQGKTCGVDSRTRNRRCTYPDGQIAPGNPCRGRTTQTKKCPCPTAPTITPAQKECKDGSNTCSAFASLCDSSSIFKTQLCPKTCDNCDAVATTDAPKSDTCKDKFLSCKNDEIRKLCKDPAYTEELTSYCPVTCNLCPKTPKTSDNEGCKDKYPEGCKTQKDTCTKGNPEEVQTMRRICPITCNTCPKSGAPVTVATPTSTTAFEIAVATTPIATEQPCVDKIDNCDQAVALCYDPGVAGDITRSSCAFTCQSCSKSTAPPYVSAPTVTFRSAPTVATPRAQTPVQNLFTNTPFPRTISAVPPCEDDLEADVCHQYAYLCSDSSSYWSDLCRRTCDTCGQRRLISPTIPTTTVGRIFTSGTPVQVRLPTAPPRRIPRQRPLPCKDDIPECSMYPEYCSIPNSGWVESCRVTCNSCVRQARQTPPPSVAATTTTTQRNIFSFTSATQTPAVPTSCRNIFLECDEYSYLCGDPVSRWKEDCPLTCGTCGRSAGRGVTPATQLPPAPATRPVAAPVTQPTAPATRPVAAPVTRQTAPAPATQPVTAPTTRPAPQTVMTTKAPSECRDRYPDTCPSQISSCTTGNPDTVQLMRTLCPVTCNSCDEGPAAATTMAAAAALVLPTTSSEAQFAWSQWSRCSVTCGNGIKTRARICLKQGNGCESKEETMSCNEGLCQERQPVAVAGGCANSVVGDWCDRMKKTIQQFCEDDRLSSTCKVTCNKC